jgi:hypothetical protein
MSFKAFPKHNFAVDLKNDTPTCMLRFTPTITGDICTVRVKVMTKNWDGTGRSKLRIRTADNDSVVGESEWINYGDVATHIGNYYYGYINFEFSSAPVQEEHDYFLCLTQEDASTMGAAFFTYVLDYNFPVNKNYVGTNNPQENMRLAAEIFFKGDYNDFE